MTLKESRPADDSSNNEPQESKPGSQKPLSLEELAARQQAAMAKLQETANAFDTLLEETISAVDESIRQSQAMAEEIKNQSAEKAAALLAEAKARAQEIISQADIEGRTHSRMAKHKVEELIEAARSSAGKVAKQDSEQLPALTGEIWAALESSIEQSLQSLLNDLENLKQETTLLEDRETPMPKSMAAGFDQPEPEPIEEPEPEHNSEPETPAEATAEVSNRQTQAPGAYRGNVNLLILLKKASDQRTILITPDQLSRQIKNTPGGSVVNAGMQGKEYFIAAQFAVPVSMDQVLAGVTEWEDFTSQSDKVKEYQKRAYALEKWSKDAARILVTL